MTQLSVQPIQVGTTCDDEDGRLVLAEDRLVAVLVRLEDVMLDGARGRWHLEAGFGRCTGAQPAPFADLEEATAWVAARLEGATRASKPSPVPSSTARPEG